MLSSASAPNSASQVILTFNEPVDLSAATFSIAGGTVASATAGPLPGMVTLTVSGLAEGQAYTVVANSIKDLAGNACAPPAWDSPPRRRRCQPPSNRVAGCGATDGPATRRGPFVLSEIHYHPRDRVDLKNLEFIELYNTQPWQEDLTGFRLTGK